MRRLGCRPWCYQLSCVRNSVHARNAVLEKRYGVQADVKDGEALTKIFKARKCALSSHTHQPFNSPRMIRADACS